MTHYPGEAMADPTLHWLDLPEATDEEMEEKTVPERKPVCSFVNRQTVFAIIDGEMALKEFPMPGDELHLGGRLEAFGGLLRGRVVGYVLNRRSEFAHPFFGWGRKR